MVGYLASRPDWLCLARLSSLTGGSVKASGPFAALRAGSCDGLRGPPRANWVRFTHLTLPAPSRQAQLALFRTTGILTRRSPDTPVCPCFALFRIIVSLWVGRSFGKLRTGSRPICSELGLFRTIVPCARHLRPNPGRLALFGAFSRVPGGIVKASGLGDGLVASRPPELALFRMIAPRPTPPGPRRTRPRRKLALFVPHSSNRLPTTGLVKAWSFYFICGIVALRCLKKRENRMPMPLCPWQSLRIGSPGADASLIRRRFSMAVCYAKIKNSHRRSHRGPAKPLVSGRWLWDNAAWTLWGRTE
jgi:hypothetical protein